MSSTAEYGDKMNDKQIVVSYFNSPIGCLRIVSCQKSIQSISFVECFSRALNDSSVVTDTVKQLELYFKGLLLSFELKLNYEMFSPFEVSVWCALREIPFGETRSYKQIAEFINKPNAYRAVGTACGRNPFVLAVPCHRVIAADGSIGGFSAGIDRKKWLIDFEQKIQDCHNQIS